MEEKKFDKNNFINAIKNGVLKLKPTNQFTGKIFKLECEENDYLQLGLATLAVNTFISLGYLVFRALSESQDMIVDSLVSEGDSCFLVGRCLQIKKRRPIESDVYKLTNDHTYDIDSLKIINDRFYESYSKAGCIFGKQTGTFFMDEVNHFKQHLTWIHNDKVTLRELHDKTNDNLAFFKFQDLIMYMQCDVMYNHIFNSKSSISDDIIKCLNYNLKKNKITNDEISYLNNTGLINIDNK